MSSLRRDRFGRRCDLLVHGGMVTLLVFSPLAIGSVHAWSLAVVQLLVVLLAAVWASKVVVCGSTSDANQRLRRWALPLLAFAAVAMIQLIPLPPALLRLVSPQTHALYRESMPGWPDTRPFPGLAETVEELRSSRARAPQIGPLPSLAAARVRPDVAAQVAQVSVLAGGLAGVGRWRSLSIYGYRSGEELLRMALWSTVFFCS